ncbi:unnamed protein product [Angiostrongylus costaricensis]|uniref:RH2 domain-containing protein n=1 Tax=Angiostrongylus costaricensis TaxID=334426 RepID=A0A158PKR4_ANGCS|nr:unnamed protein product [Angiostrongylus costaricensis]
MTMTPFLLECVLFIFQRLRTENRLLRQRIDYLEAESAALADRLVKGQKHFMELSCSRHGEMLDAAVQVDDTSMIEHIHSLQQELIESHNRQADHENTIRECKIRISELEAANKRLREHEPFEGIAGLQEELISVKMREAESNLAKYVHMRAFDPASASIESETASTDSITTPSLNSARFVVSYSHVSIPTVSLAKLAKITASIIGGASDGDDGCITVRELEDQLMGVRIKEADNLAELKEMRQKVMELETQNHVCTNQLRRQDDEMKRVREEIEAVQKMRRELEMSLRQERQRCVQRESELNEQCIMERLKYSEAMQSVQELRQTITQLELKKAEGWTQNQLRGSSVCEVDDDSTSHLSMGSNGDVFSLGSEDLNALVADMTVKVPVLDEEGSNTETEDHRPKEVYNGNATGDSGVHNS